MLVKPPLIKAVYIKKKCINFLQKLENKYHAINTKETTNNH